IYPFIQVFIRKLFNGQYDITADRTTAGILCPAIGRFHQTRPSAGQYGKSKFGKFSCSLAGKPVKLMVLFKPGRPKNCNAGPYKMKRTEAAYEFHHGLKSEFQFLPARMRP